MKLKIVYLAIVGAGLALIVAMSSCSNQSMASDKKITCTPDSFMLMPDSSNQAALNLQVHIPKHYFSKRSRLFVIPVLTDSDSIVAKYKPIVLDAPIYSRKMERKWVLDSIADPYDSIAQRVTNTKVDLSVLYNDIITLPANFHKGSLVAVASADGCGECRAISHTKIADVFRPEIKKQLHLNWMKHTFEIKPKIRKGKGVARLEFAINKYDINLKMSNNQAELDHMLSDIAPVLSDSLATLTSLGIYGLASADGPLKFNTPLSRNRANSALKWLLAHIENGDKVKKIARIGSRPEGWQPVLDAMVAAGDADSTLVKNILTRYATSTMMCRSAISAACLSGTASRRSICRRAVAWNTPTHTSSRTSPPMKKCCRCTSSAQMPSAKMSSCMWHRLQRAQKSRSRYMRRL